MHNNDGVLVAGRDNRSNLLRSGTERVSICALGLDLG